MVPVLAGPQTFQFKPDGRRTLHRRHSAPNVTGCSTWDTCWTIPSGYSCKLPAWWEKECVLVPRTDHASIATEAKVVNRPGSTRHQENRPYPWRFLKHAWAWTDEHGGIILKQLRKLGASCDWDHLLSPWMKNVAKRNQSFRWPL